MKTVKNRATKMRHTLKAMLISGGSSNHDTNKTAAGFLSLTESVDAATQQIQVCGGFELSHS